MNLLDYLRSKCNLFGIEFKDDIKLFSTNKDLEFKFFEICD